MNNPTEYILDTNVFLEAHKKYYKPSLVPAFWKLLADDSNVKKIRSINKVRAEIYSHNKFLVNWADNSFKRWDSVENKKTINWYKTIIAWSVDSGHKFTEDAKETFARNDNADPWLVAHAIATKRVVVTEEIYNDNIRRNIRIPNVCNAFNIKCLNTFQMLDELRITLA